MFSAFRKGREEAERLARAHEAAVAELRELKAKVAAIDRATVRVEFDLEGRIVAANANFLQLFGYGREALRKLRHADLAPAEHTAGAAYRDFWSRLRRGAVEAGEFPRLASGGRELWLRETYSPIVDASGKPSRVLLLASDITDQKLAAHYAEAQVRAISNALAVVEFSLEGVVVDANPNFLAMFGYTREEVCGRHHSMFVEPALRESLDYKQFWHQLTRGRPQAGEFKRIGQAGREIWIHASYSAVLDMHGHPCRIVEHASDITAQKLEAANFRGQIAAIDKSQAIVEFDLSGHVIAANENFLGTLGYSLDEVRGRHHRMFVDAAYGDSEAYREFWARLARGEFVAGEFRRVAKGGREVWIQASYNAIHDLNGRPFKVVKYATDITPQKRYQTVVEGALAETSRVLSSLANGNLDERWQGDVEPAFAELQANLNACARNLGKVVSTVKVGADHIEHAADEIAHSIRELSERTEQQASSLRESAGRMDQLTDTIRRNADSAARASEIAREAREQAVRGGTVAGTTIAAVAGIAESSKKIAEIIGVIDGIAFQTNLLALNASVEAARAGVHGRGFAVVAAEVRHLAQSSAAAALEIKALIEQSGQRVNEGSRLVEESVSTLSSIVKAISDVSELVEDIADASREQSVGVLTVNSAIAALDQVNQRNVALVHESSRASAAMAEQSRELTRLMTFFARRETDAAMPSVEAAPRLERRSASRPWSGVSQGQRAVNDGDGSAASWVGQRGG